MEPRCDRGTDKEKETMALPHPTRRDTGAFHSSSAAAPRLTQVARGARRLCLGLVLVAGTAAMAQQAAAPAGGA